MDLIPLSQVTIEHKDFSDEQKYGFIIKSDIKIYKFKTKSAQKRDDFIEKIENQKREIKSRITQQTTNGKSHVQQLMKQLSSLYENPPPQRTRKEVLSSLIQ